jgi:hypothetical protein
LMADTIRLDRVRHRQLGTSNGCRDHTVLPYATRLRQEASPGLVPIRRSFSEGGNNAVRPARVVHSRKPPCEQTAAPTPPRPPHPIPRFVTIMIRPSCRERMGRTGSPDLPDGGSGIFFARRLDRFLRAQLICPSGQFVAPTKIAGWLKSAVWIRPGRWRISIDCDRRR